MLYYSAFHVPNAPIRLILLSWVAALNVPAAVVGNVVAIALVVLAAGPYTWPP